MIIYLDEDAAYLSWVHHHRNGYVVDWLRPPTRRRAILHRASCPRVRTAKTKRTHWTTGRRLKACSLARQELSDWAEHESGHLPTSCELCTPCAETAREPQGGSIHLTKSQSELLDYVVEVAVIHLDNHDLSYDLTLAELAKGVNKSVGQISVGVHALIDVGYFRLESQRKSAANPTQLKLQGSQRVYPTALALQLLPAFEARSTADIETELTQLMS